MINNTSSFTAGQEKNVATLNPQYAPNLGNRYLKVSADRGSNSASNYGTLACNLNHTTFRLANTSGFTYSGNFYIHNMVYFIV